MDLYEDAKNLIKQSENIYILPSQQREESITSALALFYTLRELGKNVNLVVDEIPERLRFLIPSLDYISYPRNFVISIPNTLSQISQIRYEKDEKNLKIFLTVEKGNIKKSDISFSFTAPQAGLLITIGDKAPDQNAQHSFPNGDSLLNAPILNINNRLDGKSFGKINLLKENTSLTELVFNIIKSIDENIIKKDVAASLLAGLIIFSDNFRSQNISSEILEIAAFLIKKGGPLKSITNHLYQQESLPQIRFLGQVLNNLNISEDNRTSWAVLDNPGCQGFGEKEALAVVERLKSSFDFRNLFVLWESHSSEPVSKGFFYSENCDLIKKAEGEYRGMVKNGNIFLFSEKRGPDLIKSGLLKIITS